LTDRLTVVDLLSHRSGLPRHDLTWVGHPDRSRAELVRRLRYLPLSKDLRQQFQYCNLGYLVAGHIVDVLSGTSWEDFLRSRLLTPLGMDRSNLSVDDLRADADHAGGYERRQGVVVPVPPRPVTAMAPAGAINSCAADMTRWLLAQLGGGQLDGRAVMSPGTLARQHTPHMLVPEDRTFPASTRHAYGLGWLIGRYRDHRLAEHGGGIDGFQTECMLLPDDGIGVAVMTNTSSSAIAPVLAYRVLDELLGLDGRHGLEGSHDDEGGPDVTKETAHGLGPGDKAVPHCLEQYEEPGQVLEELAAQDSVRHLVKGPGCKVHEPGAVRDDQPAQQP